MIHPCKSLKYVTQHKVRTCLSFLSDTLQSMQTMAYKYIHLVINLISGDIVPLNEKTGTSTPKMGLNVEINHAHPHIPPPNWNTMGGREEEKTLKSGQRDLGKERGEIKKAFMLVGGARQEVMISMVVSSWY